MGDHANTERGIRTACNQRLRHSLRRGADTLSSEGAQSLREFVLGQQNQDGGFRGRSQESDLYYTVFALECGRALGMEVAQGTVEFVKGHAEGTLDFVHLTCLVRCLELVWPAYGSESPLLHQHLSQRVLAHACETGGFRAKLGTGQGTIYDTFLGMLACESLGEPFPRPPSMMTWLAGLQLASGGFTNGERLRAATTPVTAAALGLYWEIEQIAPASALDWLRSRMGRKGGFSAAPLVPLPDLLSTATALHALDTHDSLGLVPRSECLEFITDLWDESGGFRGHALDLKADCEYTFYALLGLGSLAGKPGA